MILWNVLDIYKDLAALWLWKITKFRTLTPPFCWLEHTIYNDNFLFSIMFLLLFLETDPVAIEIEDKGFLFFSEFFKTVQTQENYV